MTEEYKHGTKDELVPRLWIGDLASLKEKEDLKKNNITHIVTVAREIAELKDLAFLSEFSHKHYDFEDTDEALFLPETDEINEFISAGMEQGGVLVVSYSGVSRSAAVALEYLMQLMKLTYEEAVKMIASRRIISLNHNFVFQLKLFETMKCKFNKKSKKYASFLDSLKDEGKAKRDLFMKAEKYTPADSQIASRLSALCKKQADTDIKKKSLAKGPPKDTEGTVFGCGNCKHKLFLPQNVVTANSSVKDWSESVYVYIEPMEWMKGDLNELQGEFFCPSCNLRIGQWDWEGALLSATTRVVPSFRIHKALLCSVSKKNSKAKEKVTQGFKGWEAFVKDHPLGYPSSLLPSSPILSPRNEKTSSGGEESSHSADAGKANGNGEKEQEKKKGAEDGDDKKPKRKAPAPPGKKQNHSKENLDAEKEASPDGAKGGFMASMKSRFGMKKKNGKQPAEKEKPSAAPKATKGDNPKGVGKKPAESGEDFGEDNIQPVSKAQAQQAMEVTCPNDLPKELLKVIKNSKITEEDMEENFIILLNCLHFLTKRHFVLKPKRAEGEEVKDPDEGVIRIGGIKKKKKKKGQSALPPSNELITEGDVKKAFKVQEVVGEGGFGRVHSARNLKGKGRVAIKKMSHLAEREKMRNLREINFLRIVDHPCIVKYVCSYEVKEELWVIMEFMEGGTLTEALKGFNFEEKHIAYAAKEMLKGIKYLHARNLVHRDLKSGNIMMTTQGDVKLIDFGLCVDLNEEKEPEHMVGSPFWMPPEMIKRQVYGPAVDIWSFAICVLELANGQPPNRRSALKAMFVAGTTGYPQPFNKPEHWSSNFKDFIGRCLEMDPARRATADELLKHPFLEKADTKKGMKKILSHIFLQNTIDMMNLGGI